MDPKSKFQVGDKVKFSYHIDSAKGEWKRVACVVEKKGTVSAVLFAQTIPFVTAVKAPYDVLTVEIDGNGAYQVLPADAVKIYV